MHGIDLINGNALTMKTISWHELTASVLNIPLILCIHAKTPAVGPCQ